MNEVKQTHIVHLMINGEPEQVPAGETLLSCLGRKNMNLHRVVCELNQKIVRRQELEQTILKDGDTLEIITMMGGG
jgi:sulfur carrier protein